MDFCGIKRHKSERLIVTCHASWLLRWNTAGIPSRKRLLSRNACAIHSESLTCSALLTSICIPGNPTRSGTSPKDIEPPRFMGYPYSRRIVASSLSPSAPLRCDRFPPFARLASPTCELLLFCGVVYRLLPFGVSFGFLTAVEGCPLCASIKLLVEF